MMKIFLIYSFSDKEEVEKLIKDKCEKYEKLQFIRLKRKYNFLWKVFSKKQIKMADLIIFIVGKDSFKSKNIEWELRRANKAKKKVYVVKLNNANRLVPVIDFEEFITLNNLDDFIKIKLDVDNKKMEDILFNNKNQTTIIGEPETMKIVFEEYKLLLATSEAVVARRQTMNTFFLTANGVLLSMLGAITGLKINGNYTYVYPVAVAVVGILLCISWKSLLVSYGQLNTGKFAVLNKLERCLPVAIFSAEWVALDEGKNKKKYRSFTKSETKVPWLFLICYCIIFFSVVISNIDNILDAICLVINYCIN